MSHIAISAEGLSKQYRIGGRLRGYRTLRETLTDAFVAPFRCAGKLLRFQPDAAAETHETIWALKDVSFDIKQGDVVGIIGGNGAGKSTLLKILSRITEPTEGYARIHGRVGSLLEVGTGFHPELTGRENIYLNGAILGMKKVEMDRKFDGIVTFAEIEKFIDTPVKHYSSGMYVRLAFAVAAHLEPEILLVDEVLAMGDAAFQKKCLGKMEDVSTEGRTVLFVSHNMAAIQGLCRSALLLSSGTVVCADETPYVIGQYLNSSIDSFEINGPLAKSGDGRVVLLNVEFLDDRGQKINSVLCGQNVSFRLLLRSEEEIGKSIISIGINNSVGVRVSLLANVLVGETILLDKLDNIIVCQVPNIPLAPGSYTLSIKITGPSGVLIWEPDLVPLRVESGNFFKSGFIINASWVGSSLITHSWTKEI